MTPDATVADLGENELVDRIRARLVPPPDEETWSGDDAAVLRWSSRTLLLSTDMLVDKVDFDLAYCTGEDVGFKSLAVNCSDMAAMGGWPMHAVVGLGLPPTTTLDVFDGILEGLLDATRSWPLSVVGGDLSTAPALTVAVTVTGEPGRRGVVGRAGARPGDALCVTGTLGGAAAGLRILRERRSRVGPRGRLVQRQLRPRARVREGAALAEAGARAMIDVSDGLAIDLYRLMSASGTGCDVATADVPLDPDLSTALPDLDPLATAMLGGEDYELLFAIAPRAFERVAGRVDVEVTRIGTVVEGRMQVDSEPLEKWTEQAWEHLRAP